MDRFVSDDIERHGSRLGELEKKLVGAYRETVCIFAVFLYSVYSYLLIGGW